MLVFPFLFFSFGFCLKWYYFTGACVFELGIYIKGEIKFRIKRKPRRTNSLFSIFSNLFYFVSHFQNQMNGFVFVCVHFIHISSEKSKNNVGSRIRNILAITTKNYKIKHLHFITKWKFHEEAAVFWRCVCVIEPNSMRTVKLEKEVL